MRDLAFSLVFAALSGASLVNPLAGLLSWGWISFALPNSSLWGFAAMIPANLIIAITTSIGFGLSASKLSLRLERTMILVLLLAGVVALSTAFSLAQEVSLPKFREFLVNFAFMIMILLCLNAKIRIDAFVWLMVFCIGYYSLKGGLVFLISGGAYRFEGPPGTSIGDNNHLAVAFLISIPLINYLRLHAARPIVRKALACHLVLTILAVLCTQSRGGFIGLVVLGGAFWWMSGRRISHIVAGIAIIGVAGALASDALVSRLQTIETASQDDTSFLSRVVSWQMHFEAALDRPLVGAGSSAMQTWPVFGVYRPSNPVVDLQLRRPVAAHSVYFQVIGEHGFVAFGIYLALFWTAWRNATSVMQKAADQPSRLWMITLAAMTRVSLLAFAVAGAAVSMAFYDYFLAILMLTACLRRKLEAELAAESSRSPAFRSTISQFRQPAALPANRQA
jgi:probable O-glycosylation ligase (exosortase A-associated)